MASAELNLPKHMKPEGMAQTFATYLLGSPAFEWRRPDNTPPFTNDAPPGTLRWQLDMDNNWFLRIEGSKATISSRYDSPKQMKILEALVALFKAQFED